MTARICALFHTVPTQGLPRQVPHSPGSTLYRQGDCGPKRLWNFPGLHSWLVTELQPKSPVFRLQHRPLSPKPGGLQKQQVTRQRGNRASRSLPSPVSPHIPCRTHLLPPTHGKLQVVGKSPRFLPKRRAIVYLSRTSAGPLCCQTSCSRNQRVNARRRWGWCCPQPPWKPSPAGTGLGARVDRRNFQCIIITAISLAANSSGGLTIHHHQDKSFQWLWLIFIIKQRGRFQSSMTNWGSEGWGGYTSSRGENQNSNQVCLSLGAKLVTTVYTASLLYK